jgi:hypothetical protein
MIRKSKPSELIRGWTRFSRANDSFALFMLEKKET